jgi:hypothetical protein
LGLLLLLILGLLSLCLLLLLKLLNFLLELLLLLLKLLILLLLEVLRLLLELLLLLGSGSLLWSRSLSIDFDGVIGSTTLGLLLLLGWSLGLGGSLWAELEWTTLWASSQSGLLRLLLLLLWWWTLWLLWGRTSEILFLWWSLWLFLLLLWARSLGWKSTTGESNLSLGKTGNSRSVNDLTGKSVTDNWGNLLDVGWGNHSRSLLGLGDWLAKFEGGRSSWTDDDAVFNVVEFLAESRATDLDTSVLNSGLGNIDQLLGDSLGNGELGHWNVSDSMSGVQNLLVGVPNVLLNWSVTDWSSVLEWSGGSLGILDWGWASVLDGSSSDWLGNADWDSRGDSSSSEGNSSGVSIGVGDDSTRVGTSHGHKAAQNN